MQCRVIFFLAGGRGVGIYPRKHRTAIAGHTHAVGNLQTSVGLYGQFWVAKEKPRGTTNTGVHANSTHNVENIQTMHIEQRACKVHMQSREHANSTHKAANM